MQFEVTAHRLEHEFGAPARLEPTPFKLARRTDEQGERALRGVRGTSVLRRADGIRLALFKSEFHLRGVERDHPGLVLDSLLEGSML